MKTILITGGTGKFGRALTDFYSDKKVHLVFTSRSRQKIDALVKSYLTCQAKITGIEIDLAKDGSAATLLKKLSNLAIKVNYLVNNARSLSYLAIEEDGCTSRKSFLDEYLLDVVVPYEITMTLARQADSELKGVINIGSQYGMVAANPALYTNFEQQSAIQYGVAKSALVHLTKELAVRLAGRGVRVNCVAFGGVEGRVDQAFKDRYANLTPSGRMLSESDIPGPVDFLINDASGAITGQVICADGGWTLW